MSEKEILGQVFDLDKMLDYQEGSVVSRTIMNKNVGTVTLFSFDKDEGLSEHTAPFDALVYILDGEAEIIIGNQTHIVKKGQMIIMPANEPHALKALKQFKMMLVMIKASIIVKK
ncbi:MAG: cupin domain-containing protein [Candidatus Lokiarchaeota archaeon]|nr:cupin domain-containing protein [Candidatus Lokiarchaeota archaeon]